MAVTTAALLAASHALTAADERAHLAEQTSRQVDR